LTTATDLAVQNAIRTALQSAVGAAVVGEEAGAAGGNGASFWLGRWARPPALPYVASGRVAAYVLFWTSAIHAAAGGLLAAEAGASVSDVDGRPWTTTPIPSSPARRRAPPRSARAGRQRTDHPAGPEPRTYWV